MRKRTEERDLGEKEREKRLKKREKLARGSGAERGV